jgi:hypothetical protein
MKSIIKGIFCKHKYKTITNLYGDTINHFNGARSIKECINCGKRIKDNLDNNCIEINKNF